VLVYGVVFAMGIYYINRLINRGPEGRAVEAPETNAGTAAVVGHGCRPRNHVAPTTVIPRAAMEWYLPVIWAALIGTAVAMYVILDGFDLGVGVLLLRPQRARARPDDELDRAVLGRQRNLAGAGRRRLWVAFPHAYAIIAGALPAGHRDAAGARVPRRVVRVSQRSPIPKAVLEFRLTAGSTLAAFCQGLILAGLIEGIKVENGEFAGGQLDWARPFAFLWASPWWRATRRSAPPGWS
jgi:hypothetical protein